MIGGAVAAVSVVVADSFEISEIFAAPAMRCIGIPPKFT